MMAADKTVAPDRPELDWPVIFVLAIAHVGALVALLIGRMRPVIGRQIAGGLLCSRTEKDGTTTITLYRGRPGRVCAGGKWI